MTDDPRDPPDDEEDGGDSPAEHPTADATQSHSHRAQRIRQASAHEKVKAWWSAALRDPVGQQIIWQFLTDLHTFEERFACGPNGFPQPEATWFQAGRQDVGLRLHRTLAKFDREALFAMHDAFDPEFAKPKLPRSRKD
jgi:hypothetical protein